MTIADKLRLEGNGKPEFTKETLMDNLVKKIKSNGYAQYTIGRHVGTKLDGHTIGDCNPNNRKCLVKWIAEEGFSYQFSCNSFGVENIKIFL